MAVDKKLDKKEKEKDKEREAEREAERKRERDRQAAAALKNQVRGLPPAAPVRAASMDEGTSDTSEKKVAKAASSQKEVAKPGRS